MDRSVVHDVHMAINLVHRLVYFVPEAMQAYAALGADFAGGYFASRSAPLGAVPDEVIIATFYNFSPRAVTEAMAGVRTTSASPREFQAARFGAVRDALGRVGCSLSTDDIDEARSIVDPVVAGLELAGRPLAAANAALALPDDPMVALWQQVAVIREWRGDVHVSLLVTNQIGPCQCLVLQVGTGRFPLTIAQRTRRWSEEEWKVAVGELADRGWVAADGSMTPEGIAARDQLEADTDDLCASIWAPVGEEGARRLGELIMPIHTAMDAAGTYAILG